METARDRVLKAINHVQPEVTPVHIMGMEGMERWLEHFGVRDDFELREVLGLDLQASRAIYTGPNARRGLSIWGEEEDIGGVVGAGYSGDRGGYPLADATSVADVERFAWPNTDDMDFDVVAELLPTIEHKARWVKAQYTHEREGLSRVDTSRIAGRWLPTLCSLFNLFGLEETLIKLHTEPRLIETAVAHIESFVLEFTRRLLEASHGLADIYWYADDFSTQTGMLISADHWRRFVKPTYKKIFDLSHSHGAKVWFHSCGTFRPVLPDLIDIGMDVWETVQVHLPGNEPEILKREYGRDITFFGAINSQHTLPFGSPEDVRAEVRERVRVLGKGGGYICGSDHTILPDVPIENVLAMLDEAKTCAP